MNVSSLYQAGRDWAQFANSSTIERARRVARVATDASDARTVLRVVTAPRNRDQLSTLIEECFDGQLQLSNVLDFVRGIGDADPRPVSVVA